MDLLKKHEFLDTYLRYTANTESPKVFHVWVALSAISACMGRRCWFNMGTGKVYPNMYVVLVGPPGTRKGYAISYARKLLERATQIRFAPDDTGGHRQGLISAMTDFKEQDKTDDVIAEILGADSKAETMAKLSHLNGEEQNIIDQLNNIQFDTRDPRTMYATSSELNSILGENNTQMLTFLQEMYDGAKPYTYRLKNTQYEIKDAVLGILGATTPTQISIALPPEAVGQGFTSRVVFVFADKQHARIARPSLNEDAAERVAGIFGTIFNKFDGEFEETPLAAALHDKIYARGTSLKDPRFVHYCDRRLTHLQKTAMALAAGRGSQVIDVIDYEFADELLTMTEQTMPDALGEYGMSKLSTAKQKLLEYVRSSETAIPTAALFAMVNRDMSAMEFKQALAELHNAKKLSYIDVAGLGQCIIGISSGQKQAKRDYNLLEMFLDGDGKKGPKQ